MIEQLPGERHPHDVMRRSFFPLLFPCYATVIPLDN